MGMHIWTGVRLVRLRIGMECLLVDRGLVLVEDEDEGILMVETTDL